MPPTRKPAGKRQNRVTKNIGAVSRPGKAPAMPRGLCRQAQDAFHAYFSDAISGITRPPDTTLVMRWVKNVDRYHRLIAEADSSPLVTGSTGQPRPNTLYDLVLKLEASIRLDEAQLGLGPKNRAALGLSDTQAAQTLAELNAAAEDDTEDSDDFRLALITTDRRRRLARDGQIVEKTNPKNRPTELGANWADSGDGGGFRFKSAGVRRFPGSIHGGSPWGMGRDDARLAKNQKCRRPAPGLGWARWGLGRGRRCGAVGAQRRGQCQHR